MNRIEYAMCAALFAIGVVSLATFKVATEHAMNTCQLTHTYSTCYTALNR